MSAELTIDPLLMFDSTAAQRREIVQRAEEERAESRRRQLDSQWSADALPGERIRIWENLHALRLPVTAEHPLVAVIARQTRLSVSDITEEQSRRASHGTLVGGGASTSM